jgi:g-D-glutamyl-meso-diaminopimelate peptidase
MELNINSLLKRYPFLRRINIGKSIGGKNIPCIIMGNGSKKVCYNASHHANEWITSVLLMKFIENFCRSYIDDGILSGQSTRELFENCEIHIVPMVNPDGVDLVTGATTPDSEEYLSAEKLSRGTGIPFPSGWKANIRGVDLNLNYPAGWLQAREIKFSEGFTRPGPRDYVGRAPLDQMETMALAELTRKLDPDLVLAYHSQGKEIYWNFGDYEVPGAEELGKVMARVSGCTLAEPAYASSFAGFTSLPQSGHFPSTSWLSVQNDSQGVQYIPS